jgi:hypothetical protein
VVNQPDIAVAYELQLCLGRERISSWMEQVAHEAYDRADHGGHASPAQNRTIEHRVPFPEVTDMSILRLISDGNKFIP